MTKPYRLHYAPDNALLVIRLALDFYLACLFRWARIYPADEARRWFRLESWPHLHAMASRLERCESVRSAIHAEGLGEHPFTAPQHPNPPEGSAT